LGFRGWWRWREYSGRSRPSPFGPFAARMFAPASCLRSRTLRVSPPAPFPDRPRKKTTLRRPFFLCGGGGGSTQADPGLRPSGHSLRECSLRHPAFAVEPCGFASRAISRSPKKKGHLAAALFLCGGGGGSTQADPGLRPSGHSLRECSLRHPAFAVEPCGFASRAISRSPKKKGHLAAALFLCGGGGGSRTRVRRRLTPSPTCLAHRSVSSSGSTMCETHRLTSLEDFAVLRQTADSGYPMIMTVHPRA